MRIWLLRALLALVVGSVLAVGLRTAGTVVNDVATTRGSVWLIDPPSGVVVQANALSRDVTGVVTVADPQQQLAIAQMGSNAVVLNRSTGTVGRIDGATHNFHARRDLTSPGSELFLVGNDDAAFAVDTAQGRLVALDSTTLSTRYETAVSAQQPISAVVDRGGRLWAYDASLGELIRFDAASGEVRRTQISEPASTGGLALVADRPVLVDSHGGAVVRLGDDGEPGEELCHQNRVLSGRLEVAGSLAGEHHQLAYTLVADTGELLTADLQRHRCAKLALSEDRQGAADSFGSPVVRGGQLFVPVFNRSQVLVVNGVDNRIERTVDLRFAVPVGHRFELLVTNGHLWFNDLEGSKAGVLSAAGVTVVVDKQELDSVSGVNPGGEGEEYVDGSDPDDRQAATSASRFGDGTRIGSGEDQGSSAGSPSGRGPRVISVGPVPKPLPVSLLPIPSSSASSVDPVVAKFSYSLPGNATTTTDVSFVDTSTGPIERWEWTFGSPLGDMTTSADRALTRTLPVIGPWTVTLTVFSFAGQSDTTVPLTLFVRDPTQVMPPEANFSWDPPSPVVGEAVQLSDRSTSGRDTPILSWLWEFGDGAVSTMSTPEPHRYPLPGAYVLRLTVRNGVGTHSTEATLRVAEPAAVLHPDFSWTVDGVEGAPIAVGDVVSFIDRTAGGPTSWWWDFGDGAVGTAPSVLHVFGSTGEVTVRLSVGNAAGSTTLSRIIGVAPPFTAPQAKIAEPVDATVVELNRSVRFVSGTTGSQTSLVWDFGDGSPTDEGAFVQHVFRVPGTYVVRLTASNAVGATFDVVAVVVADELTPAPLLPSFGQSVGATALDPAIVGEPVRFVNTSIGDGDYAWSFGDGGVSSEREPSYTYQRTGVFSVTLTMSNGVRFEGVIGTVHVGPPPVDTVAAFNFLPVSPVVGQSVQFIDRSSGTPLGWSWDFGDGSPPSNGQSPPAHLYEEPGRYEVVLTVTDRNGRQSVATELVVIEALPRGAPEASFTAQSAGSEVLVAGHSISFSDTTPSPYPLNPPVFYFAETPVSGPAGSRGVQHVFDVAGSYTVTMVVCWQDDPSNCAVAQREIVIAPQVASVEAAFSASGEAVVAGTSPVALMVNQPVTITDCSTGGATSWLWTIGTDIATTPDVTVTPASVGALTVTLTVSNEMGSSTLTLEFDVVDVVVVEDLRLNDA